MTEKQTSSPPETPSAEEPRGDLGQGHKTWVPDQGEQGISNRPDDQPSVIPESDEAADAAAFGSDEDEEDEEGDEEEEEEEEEEDAGENETGA